MKVRHLLLGLALLSILLFALLPNRSLDIFFLLREGKLLLQERGFPWSDPFSFGVTKKAILWGQWGSALLFFATYQLGGWLGLLGLKAGMALLIFLLLFFYPLAPGSGGGKERSLQRGVKVAALAILAPLLYPYLNLRGFLFSLLMTSAYLLFFSKCRPLSRGALLFLFGTLPIWVNLHGGAILGVFVFAVSAAEDLLEKRSLPEMGSLVLQWLVFFLVFYLFFHTPFLGIPFALLYLLFPGVGEHLLFYVLKRRRLQMADILQLDREGMAGKKLWAFVLLPFIFFQGELFRFLALFVFCLALSELYKKKRLLGKVPLAAAFLVLGVFVTEIANPTLHRAELSQSLPSLRSFGFPLPFPPYRTEKILSAIGEWSAPSLHDPYYFLNFGILAATFFLLIFFWRKYTLRDRLFALAGFSVPFLARRHFPLAHLFTFPVLLQGMSFLFSKREEGALSLSLLVTLLTFFFPQRWIFALEAWDPSRFYQKYLPLDSLQFLSENHLPKQVFNDLGWGGLMIWKLYPHYQVAIDGRVGEVYKEEYMQAYLQALSGKDLSFLDRFQVATVWVHVRRPLAFALLQQPDWKKVYEDAQAVIFVRRKKSQRQYRTPHSDLFALWQGLVKEARGDLAGAYAAYREGVQWNPEGSEVLRALIHLLLRQQHYSEALFWYQKGISFHPFFTLSSEALFRAPPEIQKKWAEAGSLRKRLLGMGSSVWRSLRGLKASLRLVELSSAPKVVDERGEGGGRLSR